MPTNTYKSTATKLLATGSTTIYTASVSPATTTIIKSLYISNISTGSINTDVILNKSGSAINYFIISGSLIPAQTSFQPVSDILVLEFGDSLKVSTSAISSSDTIVSYLEIT